MDRSDDAIIDELVADILDAAMRQAQVATDTVARLDHYPELKERYGEGGLRLVAQWGGPAGRVARADIHRSLRERGLSLRQIAATTGVSKDSVARDLVSVSDETVQETVPVSDETPGEPEAGSDGRHEAEAVPRDDDAWRLLRALMETLGEFRDADRFAASVPARNRVTTAKRLRSLGERIARIAWILEGGTR